MAAGRRGGERRRRRASKKFGNVCRKGRVGRECVREGGEKGEIYTPSDALKGGKEEEKKRGRKLKG